MPPVPDYRSFWPIYLAAHRRRGTRTLHMVGTTLGSLLIVAGLVLLNGWLLLAAPVVGYGFAWLSHGLIERNRPATFAHPLWSFLSDFRMLFLWLLGRLEGELRRAGIEGADSG
jgi:hypothetical protein